MAAVGLADSYRVSDRRSTHQIGDRGFATNSRSVSVVRSMPLGLSVRSATAPPIGAGSSPGLHRRTLTSAVVGVATTGVLGRRNARAAGLPRHLALAVTEHDVHLFRTRMFDHVIGTHVATVPYGMVSAVRVSGRATIVKLTIELVDGAEIRLEGERGQGRKSRKVFDYLRDCAAAVPVGTVPPPAVRPEANLAGVLETVAGLVAKGAGAVGEQVRANRSGSR